MSSLCTLNTASPACSSCSIQRGSGNLAVVQAEYKAGCGVLCCKAQNLLQALQDPFRLANRGRTQASCCGVAALVCTMLQACAKILHMLAGRRDRAICLTKHKLILTVMLPFGGMCNTAQMSLFKPVELVWETLQACRCCQRLCLPKLLFGLQMLTSKSDFQLTHSCLSEGSPEWVA